MNRLAALTSALLLTATPALAAWSITQKATVQNAATSSLGSGNISISQNHLAVLMISVRGGTSGTITVTDAQSNSYTVYTCQQSTNTNYGAIAWANMATALSTQAITVAFSGTTTGIEYSVIDVSGQAAVSPEDTAARACAFNTSSTTTPTVTSGSPSQSGDLFVSEWAVPSTATSATFAAGGSWLPAGGYGTGNSSVLGLGDWLDATGSGAAQTNNPTTNSKAYAMPVTAFKAASAGGAPVCTLSTLDVGDC